MERATLKIGEVAKQAGVNVQTLRYYERVGILKPVIRRESGYRIYGAYAVKTVLFIKKSQELGFSLDEIKELLQLKASEVSKCEEVQVKARKHLGLIELRIAKLSQMKSVLGTFIDRCEVRTLTENCPLLALIEDLPLKGHIK
jgi:DNA-binding transcriptional MerR regulator